MTAAIAAPAASSADATTFQPANERPRKRQDATPQLAGMRSKLPSLRSKLGKVEGAAQDFRLGGFFIRHPNGLCRASIRMSNEEVGTGAGAGEDEARGPREPRALVAATPTVKGTCSFLPRWEDHPPQSWP